MLLSPWLSSAKCDGGRGLFYCRFKTIRASARLRDSEIMKI
jgi:hypothetical protein